MNMELSKNYEVVFDKVGNIKNCGRDACINLISTCRKLDSNIYFGDEDTGIMNVENIVGYVTLVLKN